MSESRPRVSIVTAAYNRSQVLRYALASAQRSTMPDFEHIVVGDACTDDTADVVASFGDPRLVFHNLERNVGEQSGPNNEGCRRARGRYVAFLNQDDLWFEDHLSACLEHIEQTGADLVFAMGLAQRTGGGSDLIGAVPGGRYEPYFWVPASLWLLRRELVDEVGPWRYFRDCLLVPSQDWLTRAWKCSKRIVGVPRVTVVAIQSGSRPGSYVERESAEHARWFDRMGTDPRLRERELAQVALEMYGESRSTGVWAHFRRGIGRLLFRLGLAFGVLPVELRSGRYSWRKGGQIDALRRVRGLAALPRR